MALLVATYRVVFVLGDLHLGFHKRNIIFDLFYFPVIEPIKGMLNMYNIGRDLIRDQRLYSSSELIENFCSEKDRIIIPELITSLKKLGTS